MIERLPDKDGMRYSLTPNRSISWPALVRVWLGLVAVTSLVVVFMVLAGAWLVVPFAGLELAAVGAGLWYTARKCCRREVITFGPRVVRVEKGHQCREQEWELPRQSVRVYLEPKPHPFAPERMWLRSLDEEIPLADFLNARDSRELMTLLQSQGLPVTRRTQAAAGLWF
ncbi:Uncharacterized membrane protein [Marinobacter daqiaonensis]|uniref:Uncharacterized membrane protein n=1 Tax=Marinobacter daqiaonensis TaxID=650891 RepID=A0A1I6I2X8_9GAMM|nr:DUF2244 domain-containing protein [Marinobacter daqiaonensis]SFR61061.1 Uncharacterized membrane protein [Marinobacter daqiaonensis]